MMAQPGHRSPGALCLLGLWWRLAALLVRPGSANLQAPGPCPDDAAEEAAGFWRSFFDEECRVEWEDTPLGVKEDLARSTASLLLEGDRGYSARHTTCRVETVTEGGVLSFDVRPDASAATEEAWTPVKSSGRRVDIVQEKEVAGSPCQIFGTSVSRYEIVGEKLDEVMTQITEDALASCPALGHYGVSLHMDQGSTIKAKRTMLEQDGKDGFRFTLKLAVNSMPEPASVQVVVTDSGIDEDEAARREAMLDWERDQDKTSRDENDDGKGGAVQSSMLMQRRQDVQRLQKDPVEDQEERKLAQVTKEKLQEEKAVAQHESKSGHQGAGGGGAPSPSLSVHPLQGSGQPQEQVPVYGNWTVLDDLITPPLCCLCGSCSAEDAPLCHGGEALAGNTTLAQVSSAAAAGSRAERPTVVPLAGFDAPESTRPPSRGGLGFGDGAEGPRRFRRRTESGYGDNFHSTVMPKRTAADHARIWAQSRALIQTVKAEGIQVPEAWHFYDHDERAKCWQPAPSQGECGSCWAFASVGALEKQICMRAHGSFVPSLSREHLVRCSDQNNACGGGNADKAYEDMMEFGGVLGTDCIPYQGDGSKHCPTFVYSWFGQENQAQGMSRIDQELMSSCHDLQRYSNRPPIGDEWEMPFRMTYEQRWGSEPNMNDTRVARYRQNFAKSRGRDRVPSWWLYSEAAMKAALVKYGAIYASYRARSDFKKRICTDGCWPPGTVWGEEAEFYESTCGCPSGHAVTVIGYGEDIQETGQRVPYWLIENSWGTDKHGNVMGEDDNGIEGWGKDPFTEDHPMKAEDQCVLAGWADSTVPRSGGCGGNENVNIRDDVAMKDGPPDGFFLGISMDGDMKLNVSIQPDSSQRFMATFPVAPGAHTIKFMVYARRHPKQQSFPVESYHIRATSLRCRGTGYVYSFTKNDTKASLSWGRATRQELEEQAKQILRDNGVDPDAKLSSCDSPCRTGRYSLQEPCLGLVMRWGSCYTSSYVFRSSWYQQNKLADCRNCTEAAIHNLNLAIATQNLNRSAFVAWHNTVMQAFTAPDSPGWMRASRGSCKLNMGGFVTNAQLTATYNITKPNGADGHGACDERHSAPWASGHFVHAPGFMASGSDATTRCPMPLAGNVSLHCENAVLTVTSNACHERAPVSMLGNRLAREHHNGCAGKLRAGCGAGCVWTGSDCVRSTQGYFKVLRGYNYHGIEEGAAFAIAEMDRFVGECPTTGWSRWSACSATSVCEAGSQRRTRAPAPGYDMSDPICADLLLEEVRSCVKPGFCPQVLVRFAAQASASLEQFMPTYRAGSQTLPYARAGATMLHTAYPTCTEAQYWCNMITGDSSCGLYMEGHFNVRRDGDYFLRYEADSGAGELHFNALGPGHELDPQFMINAQGEMYAWQDTGFHHRRRRTQVRPWVRAQSFTLSRGTYFARMTRTGWSCPEYRLRLERMTAVYTPAILFGGHSSAGDRDVFGRARQRTTTWQNNWGAISSHYLRYRELGYHGYGQLTEQGAANEILLRSERGSHVVKKVPVTKLNFTAEELYAMFGVDKMQPDFPSYTKYELVIRSTVVLPEAGSYRFKYQQDTSQDSSNSAWRMSSRRRQSKVMIRAGGSAQHAQLDRRAGSAELDVSYIAAQAGPTTFEVSALMGYDGIADRATLPNFLAVEVKMDDLLHGATLDFGTKTRYISDIETLAGDGKVRIDWPDRDDPLSTALRTSTFEGVHPSELLIGTPNLKGFAALAEGKIDAGACLMLEARVQGHESITFRGLALELCDVDGSNQYLAMITYSRPAGSNITQTKRIGWVHIGFTQPTHLQIIRSPTDLKRFELSYKPDDREIMAAPFPSDSLLAEIGGFVGEMEVGVSMSTPEAYRYAEFYNISIEECPASCADASGQQLFCGEVQTPCGTTLNCSASCGSDVCHDNKCVDCPHLDRATGAHASWECGHVVQVCQGRGGKDIQVDRTVGVPAPSAAHFCDESHSWTCHGTSQWGFLAQGLQCGSVVDECGDAVGLFDCPYLNDVCVGHQCVCQPSTFSETWECGWQGDGCGQNVTFGSLDGHCGTGHVCNNHMCCAPKTLGDFNSSWECGTEPDLCGGTVSFQKAPGAPYMLHPASHSSYSSYLNGWVGTEIEATHPLKIDRLAAGLVKRDGAWQQLTKHFRVSIWNEAGTDELASVSIGPNSTHVEGYAWEPLAPAHEVPAGAKVMILMRLARGDSYSSAYTYSSQLGRMISSSLARYVGGIQAYTHPPGSASTSSGRAVGTVNFGVVTNDGCGPGRAQCQAHMCVEPAFVGFAVASGPCTVTDGGACVQSPNYPSHYANRGRCEILPPGEAFSAEWFDTESGYDYLTVDGRRFQGRRRRYGTSSRTHTYVGPNSVSSSAPITWTSDGSVTRKGFRICVDSASLLQQGGDVEEEEEEELEPAEDEGLEEERQKMAEEQAREDQLAEEDQNELEALKAQADAEEEP